MPEDIIINRDLGIIEVHSYGNVTGDTLDASLTKVKQIEENTGIGKVLVDTTEQDTMPSTFTIFQFAEKLPRDFRFAIIVSEKQATRLDQDFFETVARNRGFIVKEFISKEKAIAWLTS